MNDLESWKIAMEEEMVALKRNNTWNLVPLPEGQKHVGCEWVFKRKISSDGSIQNYKACLVAKGYFRVAAIDYGYFSHYIGRVYDSYSCLQRIYLAKETIFKYRIQIGYSGNLQ